MPQLQSAIQAQKADEITYVAHTLKSSSAALGLMKISQYCQQLERCGRAQDMTDVNTLREQLEAVYEPSLQALERLCKTLPAD